MTTSDPWRSRIVRSGVADPKTLNANPRNWRTHPPEQRRALIEMLDTVGYVQQVVVNRTTGNLVDGHLRVELAVERGEKRIPVVYVELTEDEEARVLAALDPLAAMAGVDTDRLGSLLREMTLDDGSLSRMLGDMARRSRIDMRSTAVPLADPDDIPAIVDTDIRPGAVYQLGRHRVVVGDATKREDVEALMRGARADLICSDPPYGVIYGSAGKNAISGDLSQAAIPLSFAMAVDLVLKDDARIYLCGGSGNSEMYNRLFDYHLQQQPSLIIWIKESFVMRRNNYHSQFEIIYFGWKGKGGSPEFWYGDRKQSDVWPIHRDREGLHPTQKPVELMERAISNSCPVGGIVYEPFLGSGTTLIAAERLGRTCYGMEVDPRFMQVTITRFEKFTGEKARLIDGA